MNKIELDDMVHLFRAITDQARHDAAQGDPAAQQFLAEFRAPEAGRRERLLRDNPKRRKKKGRTA